MFNTIFNLVTQDAQVACFENAAAHLQSGGRFVIETGVPDLQSLPLGQTIIPPSELDLMARLAGMTLRNRWAGWQREPFTSLSRAYVSVYEKT